MTASAHIVFDERATLTVCGPADACQALWSFATSRPEFVREIIMRALEHRAPISGGRGPHPPEAPLRASLSIGGGVQLALSASTTTSESTTMRIGRMLDALTPGDARHLLESRTADREGAAGSWLSLTGRKESA